jgi:hypothetical protein
MFPSLPIVVAFAFLSRAALAVTPCPGWTSSADEARQKAKVIVVGVVDRRKEKMVAGSCHQDPHIDVPIECNKIDRSSVRLRLLSVEKGKMKPRHLDLSPAYCAPPAPLVSSNKVRFFLDPSTTSQYIFFERLTK